jgi:hypothetical protein
MLLGVGRHGAAGARCEVHSFSPLSPADPLRKILTVKVFMFRGTSSVTAMNISNREGRRVHDKHGGRLSFSITLFISQSRFRLDPGNGCFTNCGQRRESALAINGGPL